MAEQICSPEYLWLFFFVNKAQPLHTIFKTQVGDCLFHPSSIANVLIGIASDRQMDLRNIFGGEVNTLHKCMD